MIKNERSRLRGKYDSRASRGLLHSKLVPSAFPSENVREIPGDEIGTFTALESFGCEDKDY